ncbi:MULTISPECIES: penicillin-binding transpeptidase domain-containing protein [Clostridium]|uniref:Peptidoglycan glycosyltransferase n=1 Tax=Clostridium carnis TaxID=1530 RepID=A0ABY6T019_9CLOT|nr:penicillin-binding transpeptidase domain-containing protein [Clostridium carnis]CAI3580494.1 Penicillin-binding protein 3 [Clostridium neonatale]CAI3587000.1 Penicillin-binding protein 3 [Clostridium neonatale]CAI3612560.1 Penicillin-binding protein 3 [Clostridium neonatale]CAI3627551.1 Penicillin-binding protein 3 [Clostridium neonatale]CAI3682444.1 Penicillin-binding protein 3 [Clostridium neonatale]
MRRSRRNDGKPLFRLMLILGIVAFSLSAVFAFIIFFKLPKYAKPEELLVQYMNNIEQKKYEDMYGVLSKESTTKISKEDYIARNSKIYEGIEAHNIKVNVKDTVNNKDNTITVSYSTSFDTVAGKVSFDNKALFLKQDKGYGLMWSDNLIFPDLGENDKVKVYRDKAQRGQILDRNGQLLAGKGAASSVGIVPEKLSDKSDSLNKIAELLGIERETIDKKLSAGWVKGNSFVPIKTIPKVSESSLINGETNVETQDETEDKLLSIPGVMISDVDRREYPLKEAAAHLVGYVQSVTAEDLEQHEGEGYSSDSVIGKSGMEGLYEKDLKGQDGIKVSIVNEFGNEKKVLASIAKEDGKDIKLTIDSSLQLDLYEQFKDDKSSSVAMNPYTGEVLALVSTPSYDNNDFIMGMSEEKWNSLNEDENKPLYNRFRQKWAPGSSFKSIIAEIGLSTGAINPNEDYGDEGLSWQKDKSWGNYYVTTLHEYSPVNLENALIYSDNIYFAKAALKIGAEDLKKSLDKLGFNEQLPFEITMEKSQYSNTDKIETEIQLADSGYGQGQVLINPLHLASLYTSFNNEGNVIKPYLLYKQDAKADIWIPNAFSSDVTNEVMKGLKKVVNDPHGTGYGAYRDDISLFGKTGTAEIKTSQDDKNGTELGWFAVSTSDKNAQKPILIVSMVEDVKDRGGSAYVVNKDKIVLDKYLR